MRVTLAELVRCGQGGSSRKTCRGREFTATVLDRMRRPDQTWFMRVLNIQAAKTHLSRLVEEAVAGEEIIIAKAGRPYVRLTPCATDQTPRRGGAWAGKAWIANDFDAVDENIIHLFEGRQENWGRQDDPIKAAGSRPAGRNRRKRARRR
jgi:prevent-host-death family protein